MVQAALVIRGLYISLFLFNLRIYILKLVKNNYDLVKNGFFIREFRICGRKWRNVSTVNTKGNLYR